MVKFFLYLIATLSIFGACAEAENFGTQLLVSGGGVAIFLGTVALLVKLERG